MVDRRDIELSELVSYPRETLDIEIKGWLDLNDHDQRADLAKAILAVANNGGGYVVVGLSEDSAGQFKLDSKCPDSLTSFKQDDVQNAVQKYLEPVIQCTVHHISHPSGKRQLPIVLVPGGHRVPIKAKIGSPDGKLVQNRVYIRRPGPRSEEPQTPAEWDQLFERCIRSRSNELLDGFRDILTGGTLSPNTEDPPLTDQLTEYTESCEGRWLSLVENLPTDAAPRFSNGSYSYSAVIDGEFPVEPLPKFRNTLRHSLRNHSGWPPFPFIEGEFCGPKPVEDAVEAWFGPNEDGEFEKPSRSDFWRVSPEGKFYTRKGYDEDGRFAEIDPGTTFDITTPAWRVGELLLQTNYVAVAMGAMDADIFLRLKWEGLKGRKLVSIGNPRRTIYHTLTSAQNEFETEVSTKVSALNDMLPEVVYDILKPVYTLFEFFELPKNLVDEEIRELRKNRY